MPLSQLSRIEAPLTVPTSVAGGLNTLVPGTAGTAALNNDLAAQQALSDRITAQLNALLGQSTGGTTAPASSGSGVGTTPASALEDALKGLFKP